MAQVKGLPDFVKEEIDANVKKECRFCSGKEKLNIYWDGMDSQSFICKECYHIIRGLYIDVLLEREEEDGISVHKQLIELEDRIENLKQVRNANRKKYNDL